MEKTRRREIRRSVRERIGLPTGLLNRNGGEIHTGDFIRMRGKYPYEGVVLWHRENKCYGLFSGLWYGDQHPYSPDCYGKFIEIRSDNGMRMELEPVVAKTVVLDAL